MHPRRRNVPRLTRPERMYLCLDCPDGAWLSLSRMIHPGEDTMATHAPPVERFYDPADLDPSAPRLRVMRNGAGWELQDDGGMLLSAHPSQGDAIDAALERSKVRFSEILVRNSTGRTEWRVAQDELTQELSRLLRQQYPQGAGGG
jgi:hypothetical protein